ncbi:MAG: nitrate/nitrite transporter NrtS [Chloroflexota bacterium]|nr:nitrate/nitrite transporter NrtS [Chloroflexota bacterium]
MPNPRKTNLQDEDETNTCDSCGIQSKKGWSFGFKESVPEGMTDGGTVVKCSLCAIRHTQMLRRSLIVAIVVGSILTLLNQGDVLFAGDWNNPLYWKIPLTFCVPFCVATYGALSNGRR